MGEARSPGDLLVRHAGTAVHDGFQAFENRFRSITRRAARLFERREWHAAQTDAESRLDLYDAEVRATLAGLTALMGARVFDRELWKGARIEYAQHISGRRNRELAETFFNSITRKLFANQGVDPEVEFLVDSGSADIIDIDPETIRRFEPEGDVAGLARSILDAYAFRAGYADLEGDAGRVGDRIQQFLRESEDGGAVDAIETLRAVFFRDKGACIVGRILSGDRVVPLVLALRNHARGVVVDAVLMRREEVSILFSFARSYFMVDVRSPRRIVAFLKSIMPLKPIAELYNSLGFNKHGKTEWYRELSAFLETSPDVFRNVAIDRGMVMLVFGIAEFENVFKVIRDEFDFPKKNTRREVMESYRLVFRHDRVGRLVDAQEFEHLRFPRRLFSPELLEELRDAAGRSFAEWGDEVVFSHMYTERRVTPLNVYIREAAPDDAREAVIDYGHAIKELAAANVFPGDFLLKNFGVTRHGRVVFYDYDELCLLTDCRFRTMPPPRYPDQELEAEPWFTVAENDIFPEEFRRFLGLGGELLRAFEEHHGDLFTPEFWQELQSRLKRGEIVDVYPYRDAVRLGGSAGDA